MKTFQKYSLLQRKQIIDKKEKKEEHIKYLLPNKSIKSIWVKYAG